MLDMILIAKFSIFSNKLIENQGTFRSIAYRQREFNICHKKKKRRRRNLPGEWNQGKIWSHQPMPCFKPSKGCKEKLSKITKNIFDQLIKIPIF